MSIIQNEAPYSGNDKDSRDKHCSEAVRRWQEGHRDVAEEGNFEFVKVSETSVQLRASGILLELLLPAGLFEEDVVSDDSFLAITLDDSAPGNLLIALNEKLERIKGTSQAIPRVLDVLSQTLIAFVGKRKTLQRKAGDTGHQNVDNKKGKSNSEGAGPEAVVGSNHLVNKQMSYLQVLSDESDKLNGNDHSKIHRACLQPGCSILPPDEGTPAEMSGEKTSLRDLIRQASCRCDAAREREEYQVSTVAHPTGFDASSASSEQDEILQYCTLSAFPYLKCMQIRAEVSGIVSSLKVATALGLTAEGSLQILLEFDEKCWSREDFREPLKVHHITVTLEDNLAHLPDICKQSNDSDEGGRSTQDSQNKVPSSRQDASSGQGVFARTLLQQLIENFFHFRTLAMVTTLPPQQGPLEVVLKKFAGFDNPIIGLVCFLGTQLRALPGCCVSCWSPLPVSAVRIRTCQKELCLFKFEELGLGAMAVLQEIRESPGVVDFELSLGCAAVDLTRDVFEPFPAFLLREQEIRGRNGVFSDSSRAMLGTTSRRPGPESTQKLPSENKQLLLLLNALQSIPKIGDLGRCADENALRRTLANASSSAEDNCRDAYKGQALSYNLLRFILSTSQLSLVELKEDRILGWESTYQFLALSDFPEKEARFEQSKREKGSFFAFHGSRQTNWYSIIRNGLRCLSNTSYMSHGSAHGHGIYLASNFAQSYAYARKMGSGNSWDKGSLKTGMSVVAICEVINGSSSNISHGKHGTGVYVVPLDNEKDVAIRYVIVLKNESNVDTLGMHSNVFPQVQTDHYLHAGHIEGSTLHFRAKATINLGEHYCGVRMKHNNLLREKLEDQRRKAKLKLASHGKDCFARRCHATSINSECAQTYSLSSNRSWCGVPTKTKKTQSTRCCWPGSRKGSK